MANAPATRDHPEIHLRQGFWHLPQSSDPLNKRTGFQKCIKKRNVLCNGKVFLEQNSIRNNLE